MEFGHGRERFYNDEPEDAWKFHVSNLFVSSSSSSSSSSSAAGVGVGVGMGTGAAPFRWNGGEGGSDAVEKEHMFDKVVTPSDVGKLNRLVIPKQHAEKYFPLDAAASAGGKGMLLSFEDRTGKSWRFRYSYWNSSQSYVMTKGWSRFVKEKRLDAGDTVSFGRGVGEAARERLFIDWKRRPPPPEIGPGHRLHFFDPSRSTTTALFHPPPLPPPPFPHPGVYSFARAEPAAGAPWADHHYHHHHHQHHYLPPNYHYLRRHEAYGHNAASTSAVVGAQQQLVFFRSTEADAHPPPLPPPAPPVEVQRVFGDGSRPTVALDSKRPGLGKSVRLFGVNLLRPEKEGDAGSGGTTLMSFLPCSEETCALPLQMQHCSSAESSMASSSLTSKEQQQQQQHYSSLDLDL